MEPVAQPGRLAQAVEVLPPPMGITAEMNHVLDAANSAQPPSRLYRFPQLRKRLLRLLGLKSD